MRRVSRCCNSKSGRSAYEAEFARRVESATHVVRRLVNTAHDPTREHLYTQSGLQELVLEMGKLFENIATQDRRKPKRVGYDGRKINEFPNPEINVVDIPAKVSSMIEKICSLDHSREAPHLSVHVEGAKFHRNGDISMIQVSVQELNTVYLVDIYTLRKAAFEIPGIANPECTLRFILESSSIPKLMFDCRTDNDVLLHIAGVRLAGVIDLQLRFVATRTKPKARKKVPCLSKVIGYAGGLPRDDKHKWSYAKNWRYSAVMIGPEETMELIEKFDADWSVAISKKVTRLEGYPARPEVLRGWCGHAACGV